MEDAKKKTAEKIALKAINKVMASEESPETKLAEKHKLKAEMKAALESKKKTKAA